MQTNYGQLTYCTNIHSGESWEEHFASLKKYVPLVKREISPGSAFGIGLRLSNLASLQLMKAGALQAFKDWLEEEDCYVFTMNGFPYGGFHHQRVKDQVHTPDWTTAERVQYTIRLFRILAALLPEGEDTRGYRMDGGVSTSPLSYKFWFEKDEQKKEAAFEQATFNIIQVLEQLVRTRRSGGAWLHLDIEPEPDGLIESSDELIGWYNHYLLPLGVPVMQEKFGLTEEEAVAAIRDHVQVCYDICHFAVGYEEPAGALEKFSREHIRIGKIQVSAALRVEMHQEASRRKAIAAALKPFNESVYLHQVVAKAGNGRLSRYPDLPEALADIDNPGVKEWRSHFHVPVFVQDFGLLQSTRDAIEKTLLLQRQQPFTHHIEVETYTWEVLPVSLKLPLEESIARELSWVRERLIG